MRVAGRPQAPLPGLSPGPREGTPLALSRSWTGGRVLDAVGSLGRAESGCLPSTPGSPTLAQPTNSRPLLLTLADPTILT